MTSSIETFVAALPKTETHLHLEGSLPYELLRGLDPERFPEDPEFRRADYRYSDFVSFENILLSHAFVWFDSIDRYHAAAKEIFAGLRRQNVRYLETSVHLPMVEHLRADLREWLAAIKEAAPEGLEVRVIGGMARDSYTPQLRGLIDDLHRVDELDGIDLHGQEWLTLEDWTAPVWRRCREAGKIVKAHAGEFGGPEKVREAIDVLGAQRIEHGVRSVEDPALVERLAELGLVLDVCPISNERLQVVPSYEAHCLRQLMQAGVICTLNTDDPLTFANTLTDEYLGLAERLDFSAAELGQLARNGFTTARLDPAVAGGFVAEVDRLVAEAQAAGA